MNRHGDHAFSTSDHTRHFYPTGHGIKINHFFPNKEQRYHNVENTKTEATPTKLSTPVQEPEEAIVKGDGKMVLMSGDNLVVLEPVKMAEQVETKEIDIPIAKVDEAPVKVTSAVVSMIMNNHETVNSNDVKSSPVLIKSEEAPKLEAVEQKSEAEEPSSDSEVASSYYHTKFYYVGF